MLNTKIKHMKLKIKKIRLFIIGVALCSVSSQVYGANDGNGLKDYYKILGLQKTATESEIKKAHNKLAIKWHPDKNRDNREVARKRFIEIQEAYEVLKDKQKRAMYDEDILAENDEILQWLIKWRRNIEKKIEEENIGWEARMKKDRTFLEKASCMSYYVYHREGGGHYLFFDNDDKLHWVISTKKKKDFYKLRGLVNGLKEK